MTPANLSNPTHSCLFHGEVIHTRHIPFRHSFRYALFLVYLDLAELDTIFARRWLWSTRNPALAWFRRADHLGAPEVPLDVCVRQLVREQTGRDVKGPIRLLTHLRYFGYLMNPVSFYFCFDESDSQVEAVVAEVTNTPWGERHCYVIAGSGHQDGVIKAMHAKQFHVSPFLPMDMTYRWRITLPTETLTVAVATERAGRPVFDATLSLHRRPIRSLNLVRALTRHPLMTAQVSAAIYWQAIRLWWRGATFHPHPKRDASATDDRDDEAHVSRFNEKDFKETLVS